MSRFKILFKLFVLRDLLARERSQDALVSENGELKTNFKYDLPTNIMITKLLHETPNSKKKNHSKNQNLRDVLSVSKKLAREREEMCRFVWFLLGSTFF